MTFPAGWPIAWPLTKDTTKLAAVGAALGNTPATNFASSTSITPTYLTDSLFTYNVTSYPTATQAIAYTGSNPALAKVDGSTLASEDFYVTPVALSGKIYFVANVTALLRSKLCCFDPTTNTIRQVSNLGTSDDFVRNLTVLGSYIYFSAVHPTAAGERLYRFDPATGTNGTIREITRTSPTTFSYLTNFAVCNSKLVFVAALSSNSSANLYSYDPATLVVTQVTNQNFSASDGFLYQAENLNVPLVSPAVTTANIYYLTTNRRILRYNTTLNSVNYIYPINGCDDLVAAGGTLYMIASSIIYAFDEAGSTGTTAKFIQKTDTDSLFVPKIYSTSATLFVHGREGSSSSLYKYYKLNGSMLESFIQVNNTSVTAKLRNPIVSATPGTGFSARIYLSMPVTNSAYLKLHQVTVTTGGTISRQQVSNLNGSGSDEVSNLLAVGSDVYFSASTTGTNGKMYAFGDPGNLPPTNIALTSTVVDLNSPIGTNVGTLSTSDIGTNTHTYTIISGGTNFEIVNPNILRTKIVLVSGTTYPVTIRSTDQGGLYFEKTFNITADTTSIYIKVTTTVPNQTVEIPFNTTSNTINWGDGGAVTTNTNSKTYSSSGTYTIKVSASSSTRLGSDSTLNAWVDYVTEIVSWGTLNITSLKGAFYGSQKSLIVAPIRAGVTNLSEMFYNARNFNYNISGWNTASVTTMKNMFYNSALPRGLFNQNLSSWNTGNVTDMSGMFSKTAFNNGAAAGTSAIPLSWNTANVTNMSDMFYDASSFNQPIGTWDVSKVVNFLRMFGGAALFNQDISTWSINTLSDVSLSTMFSGAYNFNQPLGTWNVGRVTNMSGMFSGASSFNKDIINWNTVNVTNMNSMFSGASSFNRNLSYWNVNSPRFTEEPTSFKIGSGQDLPDPRWGQAPNTAPSSILLSSNSILENNTINAQVGLLSIINPKSPSFTYSLVVGEGDTDNGSFNILGSALRASEVFNHEVKSVYSIRVKAVGSYPEYTPHPEKIIVINISDVPEPPTDIILDNNSILENAAIGTSIGTFTTVGGNTPFTFSFAPTGVDNGSFTLGGVNGDILESAGVFDHETKNQYSIAIRATSDVDGLYIDEIFTITVSNEDEPPTAILLDNNTISENQAIGTTVGTLSTVGEGAPFTYSIVSGTEFSIEDNVIKSAEIFDYETENSHHITVRSTSIGTGLHVDEAFTIGILDIDEPPTDIMLNNNEILENNIVGDVIGSFAAVGGNPPFSYSLVDSEFYTDNVYFIIDGADLKAAIVFDYEAKNQYYIAVRATSSVDGLYFDRAFSIDVLNEDEYPTDIELDNDTILENNISGASVGVLSAIGGNAPFTYSLEGGVDDSSFFIQDNILKAVDSFDYESRNQYAIRIRATSNINGLFVDKDFTVNILNEDEPPTDIILSNNAIIENAPAGTAVGTLSTIGEGAPFVYSVSFGAGFTIEGNVLKSTEVFNYEEQQSYFLILKSTSSVTSLYTERAYSINILDENESTDLIGIEVKGVFLANAPSSPQTVIYTINSKHITPTSVIKVQSQKYVKIEDPNTWKIVEVEPKLEWDFGAKGIEAWAYLQSK